MRWIQRNIGPVLLLLLLSALLYVPFLGNVHLFDWDEINFAESAREMIETGDYLTVQIEYQPFWEKPPLFIWFQVLSMKIFGINEFAARFPNALAGFFTLMVLFFLGRKLYDTRFGIFWVVAYTCSILPFLYFKSGIIDPWFNLFIFLGISNFAFLYFTKKSVNKTARIFLSAFFIGLAVLTKGPVGLLMLLITAFVYFVISRFKIPINIFHILLFLFVLSFVGGFWFILQVFDGNSHIVSDFIEYQIRLFQTEDAGHGGFFGYHFVMLLFGVFPASIYGLRGLSTIQSNTFNQDVYRRWMILLLIVVLIVFSVVKTKIVHYSSLAYFPITFLAAYAVYRTGNNRARYRKWLTFLIIFFGILLSLLSGALTYLVRNKELIIESGMIKDDFAIENLHANVYWSGNEWMIGLLLLVGILIYWFITKWNYVVAFVVLSIFTLAFTYTSLVVLTPRIEGYTQNAAIEFYKSKSREDCYIRSLRFKSYGRLFYGKMQEPDHPDYNKTEWLLHGDIDKPAYFVMKSTGKEFLKTSYPTLVLLYEKNGYVFCKRF